MTRITLRTSAPSTRLAAERPSEQPFGGVPDSSEAETYARKRQDTNFKFEVAFHDDAPVSAETFAKKTRTDTSFKFEIRGTPPDPITESNAGPDLTTLDTPESVGSILRDKPTATAGKQRQDTSFSFEVVTRDASSDDATDSDEARGGRTQKDTSFTFEIVVSEPGAPEGLGSPKRKDTNFHFECTATPADTGSEPGAGSSIATTQIQEHVGV